MRVSSQLIAFTFLISLSAALHAEESAWRQIDVEMGYPEGQFAETCFAVEPGAMLEIEVSTPHPVDFNVHFHVGNETTFPVKDVISSTARYALRVADAGEYCLMFTNREATSAAYIISSRILSR